ncbi:MAG: CDP-alcohol phosphatidyltransferase family protein [bacterium]|nr:CDP-alcohol phosphatidyltransferase family protein [bacterium]
MRELTLPNILTVIRIILSPIFVVAAALGNWDAAFLLFCIAALTDMIDGSIARIFNQKSEMGAFLDPMADKLLMVSAFITLSFAKIIPIGLTLVVFSRDLMITIGLILFKMRKIVLFYRPTLLSKATTLAQILTLSAALAPRGLGYLNQAESIPFFLKALPFLMGITLLLTISSGVQYYRIGLGILKKGYCAY